MYMSEMCRSVPLSNPFRYFPVQPIWCVPFRDACWPARPARLGPASRPAWPTRKAHPAAPAGSMGPAGPASPARLASPAGPAGRLARPDIPISPFHDADSIRSIHCVLFKQKIRSVP